jgi:hypothetical protein
LGLLDKATGVFGTLDAGSKARIINYLHEPTEDGWWGIYCTIINGKAPLNRPRTVWEAVVAVDPSFQRSAPPARDIAWRRIPDAVTLARALRHALDKTGTD